MKSFYQPVILIFFCLLIIARTSLGFISTKSDLANYSLMKMECEENEAEKETNKQGKGAYEDITYLFHSSTSLDLIDYNILRFCKASEKNNMQVYLSCPYLPPELIIS